jgi:alkylation response protein AidB-like acyl-CoA dehydrogenase
VEALAERWRETRAERMTRTALDAADLRALADAGLTLTGVAAEHGGLWRGLAASVRDYAALAATLARVDPSLSLVTTMHPLVHVYWLACEPADDERAAFEAQAVRYRASALAGEFWGTITSEPGSGGDIFRTRAVLGRDDTGCATLTGEKHFGSGSGACRYMVTTARVAEDEEPTVAVLDLEGVDPLAPPAGITLRRAWDGFGMTATQSHALHFEAWPVEPHAAPTGCMAVRGVTSQLSAVLFSAVVLTILEEAVAGARAQLGPRRAGMSGC